MRWRWRLLGRINRLLHVITARRLRLLRVCRRLDRLGVVGLLALPIIRLLRRSVTGWRRIVTGMRVIAPRLARVAGVLWGLAHSRELSKYSAASL